MKSAEAGYPLRSHSLLFYVDESALKVGVEAMTKVALTALNAQ
ncbi:hypothetical protein [Shewanella sp. KJ2020]|nr:hypothetical protein [Shewanella sp. KJ2020]